MKISAARAQLTTSGEFSCNQFLCYSLNTFKYLYKLRDGNQRYAVAQTTVQEPSKQHRRELILPWLELLLE